MFVIDSLGPGGAEYSTAQLLPRLREAGHEVQVATLYDAGFGDEDRIRADGFDVRPLLSRRYLGRVRELRTRIRRWQPDIVHTALYASDMIGRAAAWRTGASVISSMVSTPYARARLTDPGVKLWKMRTLQGIDAVTAHLGVHQFHAVSEGVATVGGAALRFNPQRITVVERGRSRDAFGEPSTVRRDSVRRSLGVGSETKVVLSLGRQEHAKRHVDLIAAVGSLVAQVDDLAVFVAGREGNASGAIQAALTTHPDAATVVQLLGHRHDVADLLAAADVLAISSAFEGTVGVALEAMAMDCPIVCTSVDGITGILEDGRNALLVPPQAPHHLAEALGRVLTDGLLADDLRRAGRGDFERRFTIQASSQRMIAFYEAVLAKRGRP